MRRSSSSCHGFSLVELLVVMTVISILAGMLLPVLATARKAAQMVQCLNNLKQFGMAMVIYSDASGYCPPSQMASPGSPDYQLWSKTLVRGGAIEGKIPGGYDGADAEVFTCPGKRAKVKYGTRKWNHFQTDYAINSYVIYQNWFSLRKLLRPSQIYFIGEKQLQWDSVNKWWEPAEGEWLQPARVDFDAHNNRTDMLFFDTHVKSLPGLEPSLLFKEQWIGGIGVRYVPWGDN